MQIIPISSRDGISGPLIHLWISAGPSWRFFIERYGILPTSGR